MISTRPCNKQKNNIEMFMENIYKKKENGTEKTFFHCKVDPQRKPGIKANLYEL